jgi:adenylate kinase family enzyme
MKEDNSNLFSICFDRLLNDLVEATDLLKEYLLNDRLIDDFKTYRKNQETLASGFHDKIISINYDIKLIKSKTIKGRLHSFKEQNDMIISLLFDFIAITGVFFSDRGHTEEKEKAKPLYKKLTVGLKTLEKIILEYNKKAQKSHIGKLITVASAKEVVKQAIENFSDF